MAEAPGGGGRRRRLPWRAIGWGGAGLLLLFPLATGAPWTLGDYIAMALLFGLVGSGLELAFRTSDNAAYRGGVAVALLAMFLLIWINAAVGIIGSESNPANALYAAVLAVAIGGTVLARFRARAMTNALIATAAAQTAVAAAALVGGLGASDPPGPIGFLILNGFFVALWLVSAWLFWAAAMKQRLAGGEP